MKKRWARIGLRAGLCGFFLLCGCWDQHLLKDERNVSIGGMDAGQGDKLVATVSIRDITTTELGSKDLSEVHTVLARTTQHARDLLNDEVSGDYSNSKMRVLLLGEELAKNHDFMPHMDVYYRDPKSPLSARVAVTQGTAKEMVELRKIGSRTIGLYIDNLLKSSVDTSSIPDVNIQTLHPLDRGYDFAVPYLTIKDSMPSLLGTALFSGTRMTGKLNLDESKLYLLLCDQIGKTLKLTLKSNTPSAPDGYEYVTVDVNKAKRKFKVTVTKDGEIRARLHLRLRVTVVEDPSNHLYKMAVMHDLERHLSRELTSNAQDVVEKIQRANHDGFGIARRLMSFHPKVWEQLDWNKEYPRIPFDTSVSLQIINTGITD
ncbi:Ger(x)C family spore germination protein [Cohnella endophytica]|uniref:Ger(X)C family spore germination protein n=1 Tax=Cohnella endophytica TaxID=2419778 RepID=A0A494XLT8_9BACL|nr:Ger(x)C family spore germination protein [Cohnella endophytica]RKP51660.1 Ger(x)C family spore germination protein [Cohnella endophytica]